MLGRLTIDIIDYVTGIGNGSRVYIVTHTNARGHSVTLRVALVFRASEGTGDTNLVFLAK